jgi:WhiB family redox-sensing transcriptional regulator
VVSDEGFSAEPKFEWQMGALCAATDPELFFPQKYDIAGAEKAKTVCNECVSLNECRDYVLSMDRNPKGVWAAMTVDDRRKERRKR